MQPEVQVKSDSILGRISQQMSALERRDWELWLIVTGTGILVGAGFLALAFPPAFMHEGDIHFDVTISRQMFLGLVALLILLNTYVINRRIELRRTRQQLISSTIQTELVKLQSFVDPLTEVYNRRSLDELWERYLAHARRVNKPITLMVVDVDRFKEANTRFGHLMGDFVLAEISGILKGAVRGSDAVIRYGGDEFLVILADSKIDGAEIVLNRISRVLEDWNRSGPLPGFELTLSIGMAEWREDSALDHLLSEADANMYSTKLARKTPTPAP
jgi:diguanylate cyclase (GGDEF)-like protein